MAHFPHTPPSGPGIQQLPLGIPIHSSNSISATTFSTSSPSSTTTSTPHQTETQAILNIERNHRTLPLPSALPTTSYPSLPRFTPPVPSRLTGAYTPPLIGTNSRRGTSSASSSPPGTPPSGIRNYYINAAIQRSQHQVYSIGSAPASSTSLQRPPNSLLVPPRSTRAIQAPEPALSRRSYSADQLRMEEAMIKVAPQGQSSTVSHVLSLQRALSNLTENENSMGERGQEVDPEEDDTDQHGPIMMRTRQRQRSSPSPPGTPPLTSGRTKGLTKYPKVMVDRLHPERAAAAISRSGSELTLVQAEMVEIEHRSLTGRRKAQHRLSQLLAPDMDNKVEASTMVPAPMTQKTTDLTRQPSKAGVLSNLLKLQNNGRPSKRITTARGSKDKKTRRPALYKRSANNSTASLTTKSVFGTYPPLPATPSQNSGRSSNRQSMQFDNVFATAFAQSPLPSPNESLYGSSSGGELTPGGSTLGSLSHDERMQITHAVADILQRQDYVLRLAKYMIQYGAPSHRLEDAIDHSAKTLELNLQCVYLPNLMVVAFTDYETHTSETHLLKVGAGLDMYKCSLVHQVLKLVTHASMPVEEAILQLEAIHVEKDANPRWLTVLAFAVASFCTAPMFFGGSWIDAVVAFFMGGAVGLLTWLAEKVPSYSNIADVTMSVVVAFVAQALDHNQVCRSAIKLAGIVIILPGYTITCSILELSSRHIISGSVRLFYAVVFSMLLGYGLTIGASIFDMFVPSRKEDASAPITCTSEPLDPLWNILFVPFFAISLNIWIKAHPRQWLLGTVLSIVGYTVSYASSTYGGAKTEVSSALAAFAIGFCGNIYQRLTRQLTFQAVVCAVFFLVPGSIGLKGAMAWYTEDMAGGVNFALQMVITAIAISVGLFASALVVYPTGKSRSAQMTF